MAVGLEDANESVSRLIGWELPDAIQGRGSEGARDKGPFGVGGRRKYQAVSHTLCDI